MHWPDGLVANKRPLLIILLRMFLFRLLIALARLKGTRLIWTAHNVKPHDSGHPRLESWFFAALTSNLAAVICLSRSGQTLLHQLHPTTRRLPAYIVPHGHFGGCYPDTVSRSEARGKLGLGDHELVFLFIGQLRRYKNVIHLIECFRKVADRDWRLVIAGAPKDAALRAEIGALAAACSQIIPILEFVPDEQVQIYLRASDLVVLPYADILNSGAAILALSFGRPVVVPARGALVDLRADIGADWIMTYERDLAPETLRRAAVWARARRRAPRAPLEALDWEPIRDRTAHVFYEVASA